MQIRHITPDFHQEAFFFVVPLVMQGRWRLLRDGEAFDPEWSTSIDFDDGRATVTYSQQGDGGRETVTLGGAFWVEGGRLAVEVVDDVGGVERIAGAAPATPDVIAVMRTRGHDDEPDQTLRETFTLVREDLAEAIRLAEAAWTAAGLSKVH